MGRGISQEAVTDADKYITTNFVLIAMVFAIAAMVTTTASVAVVLKGIIIGGSLSASFAIVEFLTGMDLAKEFRLPGMKVGNLLLVEPLMREGVARPQGSAEHPLELAIILTILIPLSVGVVASARAKGEKTWPWLICSAILLCGALVTISRSVIVELAAAIIVMAWRWPIQRLAAVLAGIMVMIGIGWSLQLPVFTAFASSIANSSEDPSVMSRAHGADYVFAHYAEHFWFGEGPGTYLAHRDRPSLDNEYLSRLMDSGVLGLATYVILLAVALAVALRASAAASSAIAELAGGLSGSIAVLITAGTTLDISGFTQSLYLGWLVLALSVVALHISRHGDVMPEPPLCNEKVGGRYHVR